MKFSSIGKLSICLLIVLQIWIQVASAQSNSTAEDTEASTTKDTSVSSSKDTNASSKSGSDNTFSAQQVSNTDANVSSDSELVNMPACYRLYFKPY